MSDDPTRFHYEQARWSNGEGYEPLLSEKSSHEVDVETPCRIISAATVSSFPISPNRNWLDTTPVSHR